MDWEKQFKSLDNLRKIILYNKDLLLKDTYYFSIIFDEILKITNTIRPHLAKNALLTLSEIFEIKDLELSHQQLEVIIKLLFKKILEKNAFTIVAKESKECIYNLIKYYKEYNKTIIIMIDLYSKNHSVYYHKIVLECMEQLIAYHGFNYHNSQAFHKSMLFIANIYSIEKKIRPNVKSFLEAVYYFYEGNNTKFNELLIKYFSYETTNFILKMINQS